MDKKLLFAIVLSIGTMFVFNYYTKNNQKQPVSTGVPGDVRSGQAYRVPSTPNLNRPINTEIDFLIKNPKQEFKFQLKQYPEKYKEWSTEKVIKYFDIGGIYDQLFMDIIRIKIYWFTQF